jgi:colicin import membrane protein
MSTLRAALVVAGCLVLAACGGPSTPQDPAEVEAQMGQVDASLKEANDELATVEADIEKNLLQQQQIRDSGDADSAEAQEKLSAAVGELQTLDARKAELTDRIAMLEAEKASLGASLDQAKTDWAAAEEARKVEEAATAAAAEEQRKAEEAAAQAAEEARKAEEEAARAAEERRKQEAAAMAAAEAAEREKAAKAAAAAKQREDEARAVAEAAKRQQEEAARAAAAAKPAPGARPVAVKKGDARKTVRVEPHTTEDYLYEEVYADILRAIRAELEYYKAPLPKREKAGAEE